MLIRELVRRRSLSWSRIVVLALAFGVIEEGLVTQSLFNPHFPGIGYLGTYGRWLGVNWYWYETTATVLTWLWCLLAQYPQVEERLHKELDDVLAGRLPTGADLPRLPYLRLILEETLRLLVGNAQGQRSRRTWGLYSAEKYHPHLESLLASSAPRFLGAARAI
ncbi:hypothetical protein KSF_003520 [Reticulibacter mediterranei]|uniref:Cytochrome P450 n=1 Tax=Reticulibacter mediterranei TaxID=2778369 RepID=A0A8J3IFL3_9CHLR|nr:hypothetical protein KSF_003520 [Reticulibacter mediterranei]